MIVLIPDFETECEGSINEEIQDPLQCSAISSVCKDDVLIKTECIFLKEEYGNFEVLSEDTIARSSGII